MYQLIAPAAALQNWIEHYWSVYPIAGEDVKLAVEVFVDARADLIFNFGAAYLRRRIGAVAVAYAESNLDAQRNYPIVIAQRGAVAIVGVRFRSGGLAPFSPLAMAELSNRTHAPEAVFGAEAEGLASALRHCGPDLASQKALLDDFFSGPTGPTSGL
ncbi:MAG: hypothetical protein CVV27_06440 [Candidatus Melainabacteria bacterium HGW-Melainabacteria-1]|nr:MAG: hypothetical protein CVV27_06440 [Candidatus Melainabacteria bacterium HGW-Melainabacteria-1]